MSETLYVLAASYDDVEDAVAAFETVKVVYDHVATSHAPERTRSSDGWNDRLSSFAASQPVATVGIALLLLLLLERFLRSEYLAFFGQL